MSLILHAVLAAVVASAATSLLAVSAVTGSHALVVAGLGAGLLAQSVYRDVRIRWRDAHREAMLDVPMSLRVR